MADVKKIVDEGNKSLYWITSYFDRENFSDCTKYLNQARDKAKELGPLSNDPLAKEFLAKIDDWDRKIAQGIINADIKSRQGQIDSSKRWLTGYMEKGDVNQIQKYIKEMTPKVDELEQKFGDNPAVAKYCADIRDLFEKGHQAAANATRKEEIDKLKRQIESSARWLKGYIDKKDVNSILKYIKDMEPVMSELESKFGDDAAIAKFVAEMNTLLEQARAAAGDASRGEAIQAIKSRLESSARWLRGFMDKGDIHQIQKYCEEMPQFINELETKFGDDKNVAKFVAEMKDLVEKGRASAGEATKKEDIQRIKGRLESSARWLKGFMDKGDIHQIQKYVEEMPQFISELETKYGDDSSVSRFVNEMKALVEEGRKSAGEATRKEGIASLKSSLESSNRFLQGYIDRGDTYQILKSVGDMKPRLEELETKYGDDDSVARFIKQLKKTLEDAQESAGKAEKEKKVADLVSRVESTRRWLQQYYDKQDIQQTMKYVEDLKPMMEELSTCLDMGNAKRCHDSTKELIDKAVGDLGSIAAKQDIDQINSQIDSTIRWLNQYIDARDDGAALKYREQLETQAKPLNEKYADNENARPVLKKIEAAIQRLDSELGGIIAEKEIASHVGPAESRLRWIEQGLDNRDPDLVQKEMKNLMQHVNPLRERYSDNPNAKPLLSRVEQLEKRVDSELGELILEREINEVAPASESTLYWLLQALDNKKAHEVQTYQKQLLEKLQPLRRYAGKPRADAVLNKAQAALNRVDTEIGELIAEIEINDAASLLHGPMSALSGAVDSRNVVSAQRARERVIATAEVLRSKYASHPLAQPHLARVDAELARCENEIGDLMAQERVAAMNTQVRSTIATIEHAAKGNEKMVVAAALKKLHGLVYPLRALYGNRTVATSLLAEVDAIPGLEVNDTIKETVSKQLQKFAPAWDKIQKQQTAPGVQLARDLKQFNADTASLRKGWMWVPMARDFMLQVDALNLRVFGALPPDESDRLPIFEVSMKLPLEVQSCIKGINSLFTDANKYAKELEAALPCSDLTGRNPRVNPWSSSMDIGRAVSDVSQIVDRWVKTRADIRGYTKRLDDGDHAPLSKLIKLDPSNPVVSQATDARDQLEKWMTEQMKFWEPRWRYATRNIWAVKSLDYAEKGIQEVLKALGKEKTNRSSSTYYTLEGMGHSRSNNVQIWGLCTQLYAFLRDAETYLKSAADELENDHPEVDMHMNTLRRLRGEIELLCFRLHDEWLEFTAQNGEYEVAKGFAEETEKLFPKDPRTKELLDKFDEIKARRDRARKELAQRTRLQEQRLEESSTALAEQYEAWKAAKAPIEVNIDTVMDNIAAYKNKYILIPDKPVFYTEDTIEMNGEEWRYTHADNHCSLIGHIRGSNFRKWEQLKDTIHQKYRLPKNEYKDTMSSTLSYSLLGYNKDIEWSHSSECVAKIVGIHKWEVVESRYVNGANRYFKVDKRAPLVVIEGCKSKHLTAWLEGTQSVPEEKINGVTFNVPNLSDLIPTDVEPQPYWFGKALGAHRVGGAAAPAGAAAPTAAAAKLPAPAAVKPAASVKPAAGTPPPAATVPRSVPPPVGAATTAALPKAVPPAAKAPTAGVVPATAAAKLPPPPAAAATPGTPPAAGTLAPKLVSPRPGSNSGAPAVAAIPPPATGTTASPTGSGIARPTSPRPLPTGAAPPVATAPAAAVAPVGSPSAPVMKPLAKLPPASITAAIKQPGTPPPNTKEALLAEKAKIEAEIAAKQKRLEEINKLVASAGK